LSVSASRLDYVAVAGGVSTSDQRVRVTNEGAGTMKWTMTSDQPWLTCAPPAGSGNGIVSVSADPAGLAAGTYSGTVAVESPNAANSPKLISVNLVVKAAGTSLQPLGEFSTPVDGTTGITGAIPVTGWVVDDVEVVKIEIKRDSHATDPSDAIGPDGLVFVGNGIFVEGARPDIEIAYPGYPMNYKAGWGYMLLTNFLPNQGNGTYKLHAFATDKEGHLVLLGSKTIVCDNGHAVKPFGTIDTPSQGGDASANPFLNFGWVLTPQPKTVPKDGSTIEVYVDGVKVGDLKTAPNVYDQYRVDVATAFPGLNNSNGPVGAFFLDTTKYANGVHTIFWIATDDAGAADGIGSRYFNVMNAGSAADAAEVYRGAQRGITNPTVDSLAALHFSFYPLKMKSGFSSLAPADVIVPDSYGVYQIDCKEVELLRLSLDPELCLENNPAASRFRKGSMIAKRTSETGKLW